MAEEGAATATTTEAATAEEQKTSKDGGTETTTTTVAATEETKLGPEGEKALAIWKADAKKAKKERDELQQQLDKIADANRTESEKAIEKARKEARKEAETEFDKERRSDRLGIAVAKHARELADVDDVVLNLKQGDTDELFDAEGKVNAETLKTALDALLKAKPHLKASGVGKPSGSADGGEGEGGGGRSWNDEIRAGLN